MHLNYEDTKRWEKIYCDNNNQKKIGVAVLILDKEDIWVKSTDRNKEGHFVVILKSIQQEDILTIYAPNKRTSKQIKQILIDSARRNEKIHHYGQGFRYPVFIIDKTWMTWPNWHLWNIPSSNIMHILWIGHDLLTKIDYVLSHKTNLDKVKRFPIIWRVESDHGGIILEINNGRISEQSSSTWGRNNTPINNPWVKEEIRRELRKCCERN